ncbi:(3S)-malyl-CoA thioesterase [Achromobacter spanius]|uniref:HpcH/HpaI aldolase/citrate lyase family protein n=1 Tax=Achromobacter spanius TaxID=217203 RepID=UPI000C2C9D77|nr:CoA ester lyase [Achromobacter spanius]AUA57945.1 CoA ester lyase [Achromobacter spanius]CAB3625869.1 (3S)-malyl-CoA thioesterase [Achromobacter spanius]SPT37341.1 (3S)-malyl-CoA thioesterase [Achromobacter denitrificans]VEE60000.1 (3S)-malyl-CoA thioesterase [Achromobacter spanius]
MRPAVRPRRSVLYMPGANARALDKARGLDADALILDLEDAVAPDAKAQARAQVTAALKQGGYGRRECIVRINALDTPWGHDDVVAIAQAGADAVLLPKVQSAAQLAALAQALDAAGAPRDLPLWAMAETPLGFLRLDAIAGGHSRLAAIVVGTSDLVKDLHARHTPGREETLLARSLAVMAARAYGLAVLDGVHLDLNDDAGYAVACQQGRDQGFDGKTLIHPKQIAAANAAFAPTDNELAQARKRLDAWRQAQAAGQGVAVVDGALVENLHAEEAERVLALAASIAGTASHS